MAQIFRATGGTVWDRGDKGTGEKVRDSGAAVAEKTGAEQRRYARSRRGVGERIERSKEKEGKGSKALLG